MKKIDLRKIKIHPLLLLSILILLIWLPTIIGKSSIEDGWITTQSVFIASIITYFICERKLLSKVIALVKSKFPYNLLYLLLFIVTFSFLPALFADTYVLADGLFTFLIMIGATILAHLICGRKKL